jgi:hypothetical protein
MSPHWQSLPGWPLSGQCAGLCHTCAGFWMDNDVVLYQDISHLLATSYQFGMRW